MVNLSVFVLYNVKMKQHRRFVPHVISPVLGMDRHWLCLSEYEHSRADAQGYLVCNRSGGSVVSESA